MMKRCTLKYSGKFTPSKGDGPSTASWEIHFPDGIWLIALRQSSVVVLIDGNAPLDLHTFIQDVRSVVGGIIDAVGFQLAVPLRFEPTHAIKDGEVVAFVQPGWPSLLADEGPSSPTDRTSEESLSPLVDAVVSVPLIRYALADTQRAIEMPDDTAFYCYRAIESLRAMFLDGGDEGAARATSWRKLREDLKISREEIDAVKCIADGRRHGGHRVLTEDDRRQCLILARRSIRAAIEFSRTEETAAL